MPQESTGAHRRGTRLAARDAKRRRIFFFNLLVVAVVVVRMLFAPVVAALVVGLCARAIGMGALPAWAWIPAIPVLYLFWLIVLVLYFVIETSLCRDVLKKPRRLEYREGQMPSREAIALSMLYARSQLLASLPLASPLREFDLLAPLFMRAYAARAHVGRNTAVYALISDPDLTHIGRGTVLGHGARVVAHSLVRAPNGALVYQSAPIVFGPNVTIGGGSQVEMGVTVGAGSLVEACSHVIAFTRIPPGEAWGGTPAVFRRRRTPSANASSGASESVPGEKIEPELPALVAHALGLPPAQVTPRTSAANCVAWDSLGRMAIAAALHDRFGISLSQEEACHLDTLEDLARTIIRHRAPADAGDAAFSLPDEPELWPLLDPSHVTAALARRASRTPADSSENLAHLRVALAASFTAEPLAPALRWWCRAFGIDAGVHFCGFNQVPQALLDPTSPLRAVRAGLNVILIRPEDLISDGDPSGETASRMTLDAMARFLAQSGDSLLVADLPPAISTSFAADPAAVAGLRQSWRQRLESMARVEILPFSSIIEDIGATAARDDAMERAASAPYSATLYQRLGIAISRFARKRWIAAKKVLALDCDGTLWRGVVAEDGVDGIAIPPECRRLQEKARELQRRGVLLALVSKNEPEDVWSVFERHPNVVLRREHIATARICWDRKSDSLRQIAAELNLGLDAFVLLDDNPGERALVAANCPGVVVVPPDGSGFAGPLDRLWAFDATAVTSEDLARGEFVRHEADRAHARNSSADLRAHLQSLDLHVEIRRARPGDFPRVAQLSQKTNQFNLSLRRRTEAEIAALARAHEIRVASARDRFGDYGLIGVGILCANGGRPGTIFIDTLLMSCRALGRGVEETFLADLFEAAQARAAVRIEAPMVRGPRNLPIRDFLLGNGFHEVSDALLVADPSRPPPAPAHVTRIATGD